MLLQRMARYCPEITFGLQDPSILMLRLILACCLVKTVQVPLPSASSIILPSVQFRLVSSPSCK